MDRQKILIIFGVAWLSAALLTWLFVSRTRASAKAKTVRIMAALRDLPIGTLVKKGDLKSVEVPEKDLPRGALLKDTEAIDRALLYPVSANEPLTSAKLSTTAGAEGVPATIEPGKRAISVQITDVSGVAGLIQPNSRVDVFFTRPGSMTDAVTSLILQNVKVLAIGRSIQAGQALDPKARPMPVATLIVSPEEAQKLELAKNQGKISLALRNPLDLSAAADIQPVTTEVLDPMMGARVRARRARASNIPDLDDPKVWRELTAKKKKEEDEAKKKDAEKSRLVVDVFKGDKHVQEVFR